MRNEQKPIPLLSALQYSPATKLLFSHVPLLSQIHSNKITNQKTIRLTSDELPLKDRRVTTYFRGLSLENILSVPKIRLRKGSEPQPSSLQSENVTTHLYIRRL